MRTDHFTFELPETAIALAPVSPRDASKLLVVGGIAPTEAGRAAFRDHAVGDLPELLQPGDALVLNDTRVIPGALEGTRTRNGNVANVALNLIRQVDGEEGVWRALARPAKRLEPGDSIEFAARLNDSMTIEMRAEVTKKLDAGEVELAFETDTDVQDWALWLDLFGEMPLPPYIALKRGTSPSDRVDYQTVYSQHDGAVAAPTAGLHFTEELLEKLARRRISRQFVTLHVGPGTFLPVKAEDTAAHTMHAEWGEVTAETAAALNRARALGGRIVAVGTTTLRLLETAVDDAGRFHPFRGDTSIFITPGYRFKAVDVLMTNFHLPRSTLFMLVAAFRGLDTMQAAYRHAIDGGYRFYTYGDASLLFRAD